MAQAVGVHPRLDARLLAVAGERRPDVAGVHRLPEVVSTVGGEDPVATLEAKGGPAVHPPP